jgi:hypothetical protein
MTVMTYPLDPDGGLCPLLNDGSFLYDLYAGADARHEIKKFVKRNRWPGKPPISYSVGPETMKKMLLSLHSTREGRDRVEAVTRKAENPLTLHQVIWNWLTVHATELVKAADDHSHSKGQKVFMSPKEFSALVNARSKEIEENEDEKKHLVYLALAFAMLQPDDCKELLETATKKFPEFQEAVGLG